MVSYLAELGIGSANDPQADYQKVTDAGGFQPMLIGGRAWYHWTGVRMAAPCWDVPEPGFFLLANPSPGYAGVDQVLSEADFARLGPFSAVWFTSW